MAQLPFAYKFYCRQCERTWYESNFGIPRATYSHTSGGRYLRLCSDECIDAHEVASTLRRLRTVRPLYPKSEGPM